MRGYCKKCDYSVAIEGDESGLLECHRHSIVAVGLDDDGAVVSSFPACEPYMWCGEFERAPKLDGPSNYAQEW